MLKFLENVALLTLALGLSCASPEVSRQTPGPAATTDKAAPAVAEDPAPVFRLSPADEISITVWREETLSGNVQIDPAGNVQLPLVGEIKAAGRTIEELRRTIETRLATYLVDPRVAVSVGTLSGQQVYVLGEIDMPGTVTLDRSMWVWEAVASAGGLTTDAHRGKALVIRHTRDKTQVLVVDSGLSGKEGSETPGGLVRLQNGDVVYVPRSRVASLEAFMSRLQAIVSPLVTIETGISLWPDVVDALESDDREPGDTRVFVAP